MSDEIKSKKNVPATLGVVMELRNEMITRFHGVDARFDSLEAKLGAKMDAHLHEMKILMEQQDAKNDYVLDGLSFPYHRQERMEERRDEIENWLKGLRN